MQLFIILYIIGFFISLFGMLYAFKSDLTKTNTIKITLWSLLSWLMIVVCLVVYFFDLDDYDDNNPHLMG